MCSKVAASQTPYCYDPAVIEEIEQRVNCLEAIFTDDQIHQRPPTASQVELKSFL
ncbi:MAG: hypothetical protein H6728_01515 [Myxococcales bacterium]|nr:hypothetical protein [Myxococcales bacterium]